MKHARPDSNSNLVGQWNNYTSFNRSSGWDCDVSPDDRRFGDYIGSHGESCSGTFETFDAAGGTFGWARSPENRFEPAASAHGWRATATLAR